VERLFGALILDELCQRADTNTTEMVRWLRRRLNRSLSRQTLAAWRRGDQAIPVEVLFAVAFMVHGSIGETAMKIAMAVLKDPEVDPEFASTIRRYYDRGRSG
jgi:hypothetical protein